MGSCRRSADRFTVTLKQTSPISTSKMGVHAIPEPFKFDDSFMVFYDQLDAEHKGLFEGVFACCEGNNQANLDALKAKVVAHFSYEESQFTGKIGNEAEHKAKHAEFLAKVGPVNAPLDDATVNYVKDWLVQHIKNTDFGYKGALQDLFESPQDLVAVYRFYLM